MKKFKNNNKFRQNKSSKTLTLFMIFLFLFTNIYAVEPLKTGDTTAILKFKEGNMTNVKIGYLTNGILKDSLKPTSYLNKDFIPSDCNSFLNPTLEGNKSVKNNNIIWFDDAKKIENKTTYPLQWPNWGTVVAGWAVIGGIQTIVLTMLEAIPFVGWLIGTGVCALVNALQNEIRMKPGTVNLPWTHTLSNSSDYYLQYASYSKLGTPDNRGDGIPDLDNGDQAKGNHILVLNPKAIFTSLSKLKFAITNSELSDYSYAEAYYFISGQSESLFSFIIAIPTYLAAGINTSDSDKDSKNIVWSPFSTIITYLLLQMALYSPGYHGANAHDVIFSNPYIDPLNSYAPIKINSNFHSESGGKLSNKQLAEINLAGKNGMKDYSNIKKIATTPQITKVTNGTDKLKNYYYFDCSNINEGDEVRISSNLEHNGDNPLVAFSSPFAAFDGLFGPQWVYPYKDKNDGWQDYTTKGYSFQTEGMPTGFWVFIKGLDNTINQEVFSITLKDVKKHLITYHFYWDNGNLTDKPDALTNTKNSNEKILKAPSTEPSTFEDMAYSYALGKNKKLPTPSFFIQSSNAEHKFAITTYLLSEINIKITAKDTEKKTLDIQKDKIKFFTETNIDGKLVKLEAKTDDSCTLRCTKYSGSLYAWDLQSKHKNWQMTGSKIIYGKKPAPHGNFQTTIQITLKTDGYMPYPRDYRIVNYNKAIDKISENEFTLDPYNTNSKEISVSFNTTPATFDITGGTKTCTVSILGSPDDVFTIEIDDKGKEGEWTVFNREITDHEHL